MKKIIVVGAGLAGMTAAYRLQQRGFEVVVLESESRTGGRIASTEKQGCLLDLGPTLITDKYRQYLKLVHDLGLDDQLVDSAAMVGVVKGDDLHLIDAARPLSSFIKTPLLSAADKLRLVFSGLALLKPLMGLNPYQLSNRVHYDTTSMDHYLNATFGKKLNEALLAAVARGVTLSTPEKASVIEFFAGAVAASGKMQNLKGGMAVLPDTLAKHLDIQLNCPVQGISRSGDKVDVRFLDGGELRVLSANACVLTARFKDAADIYPPIKAHGRRLYEATEYNGCYSLQLIYRRRTAKEPFIIMVPTSASAEVSTVFLEHMKAPDRAPATWSQLTVFFNLNSPIDFASWSDEKLEAVARRFVEKLFPELNGHFELSHLSRWPYAAHMGNVGYYQAVDDFLKCYPRNERVQLASDYMAVSGQESAVVAAENAVARISSPDFFS